MNLLNTKLTLLTNGVNVDTKSLQELLGDDLDDKFKCNTLKVSDRHFISPNAQKRRSIPDELILHGEEFDSIIKLYYKPDSDIILTAKKGRITLEKNGDVIYDNISLVERPKFITHGKEDGIHDIDKFVSIIGLDKISIVPYSGCYLWEIGKPCSFCGGNPKRLGINKEISAFNLKEPSDWKKVKGYVESNIDTALSYLKRYDTPLSPHTHFMLIGGNLEDLDLMWELHKDILDVANKHIDISETDSYITLLPPKNLGLLDQIKKRGINQVMFNLEVYGKEEFQKVCPGKELQYGYENMIAALKESVDIFGFGNVRTNMVLGAQDISKLEKGVEELAKMGVVVDYSVFFPRPGSIWANRNPPNPKDILSFTEKLASVYKEYSFKQYGCTLSSRSSLINEILVMEQ